MKSQQRNRITCKHCDRESVVDGDVFQWEGDIVSSNVMTLGGRLYVFTCQLCGNANIMYEGINFAAGLSSPERMANDIEMIQIYPTRKRNKDFVYVDEKYINEYNDACHVLEISPKACAVLCRRIAETILTDECKLKGTLEEKIDKFILDKSPPSPLLEYLPSIRLAGNRGAHEKRDISGIVVEVEKNDCVILLETIEMLFDFVFMQPKIKAEKIGTAISGGFSHLELLIHL